MLPCPARFRQFAFLFIFLFTLFLFTLSLVSLAEQPPVQPRIVQPVDEAKLTVLKGNTHRLARPQFDQGAAPADLPMARMLLVLKRSPGQESALRTLLDDQQDKDSPNYHKWLTPEQFGKQFGPADQDMQTVTAWLQSHGFTIGNVAKGRNIIEFSGTAAQVQEALHTTIHKYVVNGQEHWANSSDPQIPTALTPVVAGVYTLHNFLKKPMLQFKGEKVAAKLEGNPPHVTFPGNPPVHALGPADYATIYNINPLYKAGINGNGKTIAVVGRSDVYEAGADIGNFRSIFGFVGSAFIVTVNGPDPGDLGGGEEAEATLDSTWAGAIAQGADVLLVVSATTNTTDGVDLSESYIIDNNAGDIMTESFGSCEAAYTSAEAQGIETLAQQAAAQGITYMVATGDSGAEGCDSPDSETVAQGPISVNIAASTPYTVAVGGTQFNENGQDSKYWSSTNTQGTFESALSYIPEDVWNQSCTQAQCGTNANIAAGGGGASSFFTKPSWQSGVKGIPNDGKRDIPDISLTAADHDPYLICLEGSCVPNAQGEFSIYLVGGTSASTPSFAGIMALVDQKANARQGQANYVLYKLASTESLSQCNASNTSGLPANSCIFNDVTVGNNAVPGETGYGSPSAQYQSGVGYDLATGLGSVNVTNLVNKWSSVTFKPTTTTIVSLSPTTITHGQAVNADITVTGSGGVPTGEITLQDTDTGRPVAVLPLTSGSFNGPVYSLPGGFYPVIANYSGDDTFAPSSSVPPGVLVTVNAEPSTTTLSVLGYPNQNGIFPPFTGGTYGTFVYLRADVKGQSGKGIAWGVVNFMDGTASVGGNPYFLNSQGNTATPNGLFYFVSGVHSITANYGGDQSFNASASAPTGFTITQASTTTTVTSEGTALAATVSTNSGGNPPSGTVTFYVDGVQSGNPVAVSGHYAKIDPQSDAVLTGAWATAKLTAAKAPTKSFSAIYNGDTNYRASTSSTNKDFSLAASVSSVTVSAPGGSGSLTLTITAVDGFAGALQFGSSSCSGLPTAASCSFSPASITGSGTTKLTVSTTAATAAMLTPGNRRGLPWWMTSGGTALAAVVLLGVPTRRSKNLLSLIACVLLITVVSCGGGGSSSPPPPPPSTPTGKYTVMVTAASAGLSHDVSFTLDVE